MKKGLDSEGVIFNYIFLLLNKILNYSNIFFSLAHCSLDQA